MTFGIQPAQSPFNPMVTAAQLSMQDPATFHAGLALFASIWANTHPSGSQLEAIYHKVECVRIISNRLNGYDSPSDWTFHAVMLLWGLEVWTHKSCKSYITN
jgi:hypothetical protein